MITFTDTYFLIPKEMIMGFFWHPCNVLCMYTVKSASLFFVKGAIQADWVKRILVIKFNIAFYNIWIGGYYPLVSFEVSSIHSCTVIKMSTKCCFIYIRGSKSHIYCR